MAKTAKTVTAQTIFAYAEAFAEAANNLKSQAKEINKPTRIPDAAKFAPMATVDAFALELYLKCLHLIDHGKPSTGHDFKKLFEALKPGTQKSVRVLYNGRLASEAVAKQFAKDHPTIPMGLDHVLEMSKKTFETMRYLYEKENAANMLFYWPMVRLSVRDTILAIHPAWKK